MTQAPPIQLVGRLVERVALEPREVQAMRQLPGVHDVHDVHLWTITTGMDSMSGHVVVKNLQDSPQVLSQVNAVLSDRFGITHTTVQLESPTHVCAMRPSAS